PLGKPPPSLCAGQSPVSLICTHSVAGVCEKPGVNWLWLLWLGHSEGLQVEVPKALLELAH
ncbi:MAG: hypothetical protein ACSLFL_05000, partial [Alphaproteobacteria bacterium]